MRRLLATLTLTLVVTGCRSKQPEKAAISPTVEEKKPAKVSWVASLKGPVAIRIEAPARDAEAVKPFVALCERYRKAKADLTISTTVGDKSRIEIGYGGKTFALGADDGVLWSDVAGTSYLIARTLHEARDAADGVKHRIGFLFGRKQPGLEELKADFARTHPSYALETVDAYDKSKPIPPELEALIVAGPREGISERELRRVDEFLMRGRSVAILTSHAELKFADPSMNVSLASTPMAELLAGYGLTTTPSLAIDKRALWNVPSAKKTAKPEVYPLVVLASASSGAFDNRIPALFALQTVPLLFASELTIDNARATRNGATVTTVLRTSDELTLVDGTTISAHPSPDKLANGASKQRNEKRRAVLAVTVEGAIGSAYDKPGEGVNGVPRSAVGGHARLFVMSAAGFLGNAFRDAGHSPFAGQMPGMDPNLGADDELLEFAKKYDPLVPHTTAATGRIGDWLVRRDEEVEP